MSHRSRAVLTAIATTLTLAGPARAQDPADALAAAPVGLHAVTFQDWSGTVEVQLFVGPYVTGVHNIAEVGVPVGWVVVGGGAEIEGAPLPGALLTGSEPSFDLTRWRAASKDHLVATPHSLRAWALGLRLRSASSGWMSEGQLRSNMYISVAESCNADGCQPVNHPGVNAYLYDHPDYLDSDIMIGGGSWARDGADDTPFNGAGQLLTQSIPIVDSWAAHSRDHGVSDPGWVRATAIGIRRCPAGYDGCLQKVDRGLGAGLFGNGYMRLEDRFYDVGDDNTYALTTIGGWANSAPSAAGRFLTDLIPTVHGATPNGGVIVTSKDHEFPDRGGSDSLISYMIGLRKQM